MKNQSYWLTALLLVSLFASGCETVKGIGRDITGASSTVQEQFSGGNRSGR